MNREQFVALLTAWNEEVLDLSAKKGNDYANCDVLANFKRMHEVCRLYDVKPGERPSDVYWFYILIKFDRLRNLITSGKEAQCESMQDSLQDLILYTQLLRAHLEESMEPGMGGNGTGPHK